MKTKFIALALTIGLGFAGWKGYSFLNGANGKEIKYYGNVDTRTVALGFRFLGQIKNIEKDEGMAVKKGEKLAELDNSNLLNSLKTKLRTHNSRAIFNHAFSRSFGLFTHFKLRFKEKNNMPFC